MIYDISGDPSNLTCQSATHNAPEGPPSSMDPLHGILPIYKPSVYDFVSAMITSEISHGRRIVTVSQTRLATQNFTDANAIITINIFLLLLNNIPFTFYDYITIAFQIPIRN